MRETTQDPILCTRCGERLNPKRLVWLELSWATTRYSLPGTVPADESQGCFTFGNDCAKAVLNADGVNHPIKRGTTWG